MTKKNVLLSSIVLSCLVTGTASGQSLGLDRPIGIASQQTCSATDMAIAFNGWIYSACRSGEAVIIKVSKDRGLSWQPFAKLSTPGLSFDSPAIVASGHDEQSLGIFVAGIARNHKDKTQTIFVRRYQAATGDLLGESLHRTVNGELIACDLAGGQIPGETGLQESISLLYALSSGDSRQLLQQSSADGGMSFSAPHTVTLSKGYFRNIAISYGRSDRASAGRYFMAWDEYIHPKAAWGKVYTARNTSGVASGTTAPVQLDAADPQMAGKVRRPVIAVSTTRDNDSASCTAVCLAEYDRGNGATAIAGFTNARAHFTAFWKTATVADAGAQPVIAFDPVHQQFAVSYYQKDKQALHLLRAGYKHAGTWKEISSNYADFAVQDNPAAGIAVDPQYGQAAFIWNTGISNDVNFDAEYNLAPATPNVIEARRDQQGNVVSWTAGSAEDNGLIGLERSVDGQHFQSLANVHQKGSPFQNEFRDFAPARGVNYYRLKLAQGRYSAVAAVFADQQAVSQLKLFPNPVINKLTIATPGADAGASVTVLDATGKACLTREATGAQTMIDLQQLPAGNYIIRYHSASGDRFEKISKINR
ncbi:T9SS type A sorting domain-containing protein [Taibaiella helva]|uniref:T9SS type A sorting domain-containing protein n=1 Tax=Taibaiella helva TaxID=2301235 RepID=UPI000E583B68|nr:T9SS type A sorting domain-containing protein [Taibaiella helva]